MGLAEPWSKFTSVVPPASCWWMFSLSEFTTSAMLTMAVLGNVASLTAPKIMECEWQSRMPGVTCNPVPSISWTAGPAASEAPTAWIFPLATSRSARDTMPCGPLVQIVALRTITEPG